MPDLHAARDRIDFVNFDTWGKVESAPVDFLKTPDGRYFDRPIDAATGSQVASIIFWIYWFGQFFIDELITSSILNRAVSVELRNADNTEATCESRESVETTRVASWVN